MFLIFMSHFSWMNTEEFYFGGECGVSFFFMLSGFVLSHAHGKEVTDNRFRHKRFIARQLFKIYPLHIATLIGIILIGIKAGNYPDIGNIALNITLLQSWIPIPEIHFGFNSVSWFLSDMMFFYIMFPVLLKYIKTASRLHIFFGITAIAAAYTYIQTEIPEQMVNSVLYVSPALRIIDFTIGIVLYRLYASEMTRSFVKKIKSCGNGMANLIECVAILIMIATYCIYQTTEQSWRCASIFWITMPIFIYIMAISNEAGGIISYLLKNKKAIWMSSLTMEIFMTHKIIIDLIKNVLIKINVDPGYLLTCAICIATTITASYLTDKYFVRILNNYLKRKYLKA